MSAKGDIAEALRSCQFSGVARIVHRGQCLLQHAAGHVRLGEKKLIATDTRFAAASVSKMFTAICLARLAEHGLCKLDRPVADYVPEASRFGAEFTLKALLSHRSGLGDYINEDARLPFANLPVNELTHIGAFLPYVLKVELHRPGTFRYSSAGYILLGSVIEAVTRQPYPQAINTWVLQPANLVSTGFNRLDDNAPNFAWGYLENGEVNHRHLPPVGGPDGGVVTTAPDLESFFTWVKSDAALSDVTREVLWQQTSEIHPGEGYAHGFDVMTIAGRTWLGHTGSDSGVSARVMFDRDSDSSIIVLCNRGSTAFRVFRLVRHWIAKEGWPDELVTFDKEIGGEGAQA